MKFNKNEFGWKEKVNTNELPDDLSIGNSLTVGIRIRDIGQYSVAEGYQNTASGECSHAEGESTTASGITSHAEGESTIASGECSHAEGCYTEASGCYSHAEGEETTASGNCSHAEGSYTTASGECSHAEGEASNLATDIIQDLSSSTSNDDILTAWNENSFSLAKGTSSHVEGKDCLALGDFSHAEGNLTTASGDISHAEGDGATASGIASHAEGVDTTASGIGSHAEGSSSDSATIIIQNLSSSTTNDSIITTWKSNKFSLAKGESSHVEGFNCLALDNYSHAEGNATQALYQASHAEGTNTVASDICSHAEGYETIASGGYSHAEGSITKATELYSHAEGNYSEASGNASHAEGYETIASGVYSHAEGYKCKSESNSSHAEGCLTEANNFYTHAEGFYTIAKGYSQHVQGKCNIEDTAGKYAHIVGNGESETERSNAHTLDWQGNGWYQGKLSQDGTPTEDKDLATKKYVDDTKFSKNYEDLNNEPFTFVPIKLTETNESNGAITAYCDVFDLEQGHRYVADFTKYDYVCLYTFNSDNTKNTLVATTAYLSTGRNGMITVLSSSATKRDILWMSAYGSEQIRIIKNSDETFTITNTLIVPRVTNTREFTPTSNYHLVHKKYVDDAIANQPQISFNENGELVVTINGVSKTFVPKE